LRNETAVISVILKIQAKYSEERMYDESKNIQELYYDPFQTDENKIKDVLYF
jgi:hypothetical protein